MAVSSIKSGFKLLDDLFGGAASTASRTAAATNAIRSGVSAVPTVRTTTSLIPRIQPLSPQLVRMADNVPQITAGRVPFAQIAAAPPRTFAIPRATTPRGPFPMPATGPVAAMGPAPTRLAISAAENPETLAILRALQVAASRAIPMGGRVAAPTMPRAIGAAPRVATPGVSRPYVRPEPETFAMGGRTQAGPPLATTSPTQAGPPLLDAATRGAASAATAGRGPVRTVWDAATSKWVQVPLTTFLGYKDLAPLVSPLVEKYTGIDLPDVPNLPPLLEAALYGLSAAGLARGAVQAGRTISSRPTTAAKLRRGAATAGAAVSVPFSISQALSALQTQPPPAEAAPETDVVPIPEDGITGPGGGAPPGTPENDAETQLDAIDAAFQAAVDQLTASYGGAAEALRALESGDPYLAQALASLDAQYRQAQTSVAAEYSAAVGDIAGYQQQVDALMQEVAAEQAADFEAAAGGLEGMAVGVDPATAALAAEAGVSDTAVGGGAVTGAGLARGLAGAASAAGAAERIRTGSELAGIVAAARQDAAAQQAALTQNYLGQRYQTEVEALQAEAARRQAIQDALVQNELELGQALAGLQQQRAQQLAALSPADYAEVSGTTRAAATNPRWFGAAIEGDFNAPVGNLTQIVKGPDGNEIPVPATVGTVNATLDQLYNVSSSAREFARQGRNAEAYDILAQFYANPNLDLGWFNSLGVPTTAYQAYTDLFGQAPF